MNSSWKRDVALCLVPLLGDPGLITYVLDILRPLQRDHDEQEARKFHQSLRINPEERCALPSCHLMNQSVPITCTLPFDGDMWRRSTKLLKMVRYFRDGFMVWDSTPNWLENGETWCIEQDIPGKIRSVNLIYDDSTEGIGFRSVWCLASIEESLFDYELLTRSVPSHRGYELIEEVELPSLLTWDREHLGDASAAPFLTVLN